MCIYLNLMILIKIIRGFISAEFHPCGLVRAQIAITAADARMARYFRLFNQFTIKLARMPAMTGAAKSCQKAMPSSASVI